MDEIDNKIQQTKDDLNKLEISKEKLILLKKINTYEFIMEIKIGKPRKPEFNDWACNFIADKQIEISRDLGLEIFNLIKNHLTKE